MRILVLNGGTATVKGAIAVVERGRVRSERRETVELPDGDGSSERAFAMLFQRLADALRDVVAVGHRVVHGGTSFTAPTVIDADVEAAIAALVPLAPLHNPVALAGIAAARARWPTLPMAAVFDTAFHADRSPASRHYALPMEITRRYALYRYGFHGIAHASLAAGVAALEGSELRDVVAVTLQLGQGCSACAIDAGRSIETSMGFTPLEGLVMGTRSGDLDPGLVLHLIKSGMTVEEVEAMLTQRSGLLGVGGSRDMRVLLEAESRGDAAAALALTLFVRRVVAVVGAYLTLLGGRGALVFGGGIGENAPEIRRRVGEGLRAWNVVIDPARNASGKPGSIATAESRRVYVVPTDEESLIAAETARLIRP